ISCDVGIRKPSKEIYKIILKKLKMKPGECVFIDNQEWNTKPAEKLGMKSIVYSNNKQTFKELNKLGVKVKK
ncbi:MAG: HAD-IA family hydrolase, partial [Candidatus Magasanikbacteria bacterium]|nr:HAD-IA family hydrolase [Candidatus Magasanikbacteria bacterium]